ncbi:MAG: hypothetical protein SGBAC_002516 [Bacillariaceae sp.]
MTIRKQPNAVARPSWVKSIPFSISAALVLGHMLLHQRLLTKDMTSRLLLAEQDQQQHNIQQKLKESKYNQRQPQASVATNQTVPKHREEDDSSEQETPCDIPKREELQSETTTETTSKQIQWLSPCNDSLSSSSSNNSLPFWMECDPGPHSIDVVLTVYKRSNLRLQLEMLVNQTLQPQTIFIYQSEYHVQVEPIVQAFQSNFIDYKVPIHVLQTPVDVAGYHGRFYMAYTMSRARYISVWDDDVSAGSGWLQRVATFLNDHNDMYIASSGGRMVQSLVDPKSNRIPIVSKNKKGQDSQESHTFGMLDKRHGEVDFCVHNYNLRRELLRYWLGAPVQTYYTGEDMQLAFALQQYGVRAYKLGRKLDGNNNGWADGTKGLGANNKNKASYKMKRNEPRQWLICKLVVEGFQTANCANCNSTVAKRCVDYYENLDASSNKKKKKKKKEQG